LEKINEKYMGLTLDAKGLDLENVVDNKFDIKRTIAILT